MAKPAQALAKRIDKLKTHLERENPLLVETVGDFQKLDQVAYRTGLLDNTESFANHISWWPLVSVLGTFSAGKSTFINNYVGLDLQRTGNQAVDDKFTVLTFSGDDEVRVLPGLALDADPRFPFYQISEQIEEVASGEGGRIDSYLQLKTCHSENLRGRILIDSPGFDADEQRNTILRITDHIVDLSDLVLVFFDARHPEPGAMQDTLEHLVRGTIDRNDANKFVFILNQIDTTAKEDNLEEVVAAWQKAIVQTGMTAGTFYCSYSDSAAVPIEDDTVRERYERRCDRDLGEIYARIEKVGVERAYRIIGALENTANAIEQHWMPKVSSMLKKWRRSVLMTDLIALGTLIVVLGAIGLMAGVFANLSPPAMAAAIGLPLWMLAVVAVALLVAMVWGHFKIRKWHAKRLIRSMERSGTAPEVINAFKKNTRFFHSVLTTRPVGWTSGARKKLAAIRESADDFVQALNDRFTNPSGAPSSKEQQ